MRTVFLGTSEFAAVVLARLAAGEHRPALVLTRPDRPRGRGRKLASPPVGDAARELGIELAQPESVNSDEARERISAARPEAVCVCAFGALIKEPLLSDYDMPNVHPSLLPRWRGAAPVERAIEAGDAQAGVSIMRLTAGLDEGPVYAQRAEPIGPEDDYGSLAERLAHLGGELLVEVLDTRPEPWPQKDEGATYAAKIERGERRLDPERTAEELERKVRALNPHVGTYLELGSDARLGVRRAKACAEPAGIDANASASMPSPSRLGELVREGERLLVATADGALELLEVQPAGGRPMPAAAWLRGRQNRVRG